MARIHHSAICTTDLEASLRFWRDGLGLEVQLDHRFHGDWPTLFGARGTELHAVFLGDPADPEAGVVELVELDGLRPAAPTDPPGVGFFLLSLYCEVDATLARLAGLGVGGTPRRTELHGVTMAVVHDPNGVRVELMDLTARANVARLSGGAQP